MTDTPQIAQKGPYGVQVEAGKTYFWCACGRSQKQPFCDGSHTVVGMAPIKFQADATKTVYFCGCKSSASKPFCDGTHKRL
jgi:CDGSH-type Zn-finger protein